MNRIVFECAERGGGDTVAFGGERARHVFSVLGAKPGDTLRVGEIGGLRYDTAKILACSESRCEVELGPGSPPPPRCGADLLLALPRPKCLRRLLPQLAALGPAHVFITAAEKVEKSYWGSALLDEARVRPLLLEGLSQAGDTILPQIRLCRRLKPLVQDELPALYPAERRFIAHPSGTDAHQSAADFGVAPARTAPAGADGAATAGADTTPPALVAVGPEGGWSDFELNLFEERGFRRISLGERPLRTDTAVVALLSRFLPR